MIEVLAQQPAALAALIAAIALVLNGVQRILLVIAEKLGPLLEALVDAVRAWTRRTGEERDCAPKLRDALEQLRVATVRLDALHAEVLALRRDMTTGSGELAAFDVVEEHESTPTGEQHLPAGVPPRPRKGSAP